MANSDAPFGLRPVNNGGSSAGNGRVRAYFVPASYGTALFIGDPVVVTGTSNTAAAGEGSSFAAGTLAEINKATAGAGNRIAGAIVGFQVTADTLSHSYNPASTARVVYVADDPEQLFEIQADSGAAVAATDIPNNADVIFTHAGSTATSLSGVELDTSDISAAATGQLTILGLAKRPNNELGTHAKLLVKINYHSKAVGV